ADVGRFEFDELVPIEAGGSHPPRRAKCREPHAGTSPLAARWCSSFSRIGASENRKRSRPRSVETVSGCHDGTTKRSPCSTSQPVSPTVTRPPPSKTG